ncbi:MAG: dethiobiotin synthase [Helicobacteraceae bacterium]|jgi:dethiobiotin synthetase|nr:dethiobiotin synthase [Helicobacteraceae bacterium]
MRAVFVTGTGTGAGKTFACEKLLDEFWNLGISAAPFKPIETGVKIAPKDAKKLLKIALDRGAKLTINEVCPVTFALPAAPYVAGFCAKNDLIKIKEAFANLSAKFDLVLIEGAGGAFAPLDLDFFSIDLATLFDAKILMIANDKLGTIHNVLTTIEAIKNRVKENNFYWAASVKNNMNFNEISAPYLSAKFPNFFQIPRDINLLAKELIK